MSTPTRSSTSVRRPTSTPSQRRTSAKSTTRKQRTPATRRDKSKKKVDTVRKTAEAKKAPEKPSEAATALANQLTRNFSPVTAERQELLGLNKGHVRPPGHEKPLGDAPSGQKEAPTKDVFRTADDVKKVVDPLENTGGQIVEGADKSPLPKPFTDTLQKVTGLNTLLELPNSVKSIEDGAKKAWNADNWKDRIDGGLQVLEGGGPFLGGRGGPGAGPAASGARQLFDGLDKGDAHDVLVGAAKGIGGILTTFKNPFSLLGGATLVGSAELLNATRGSPPPKTEVFELPQTLA